MPDFLFTDTAEEAYQKTVSRNVAGSKLSARLWNITNENQRNVSQVIEENVRIGRSVTSAGKEILKINDVSNVKLPKYVQELRDAGIKARALSDNSILEKTVRKYQSYINNLTRAGAPEYQHLGIRGASRMLVKRLKSANDEVFDSAVDKWVGRKASYQARVLARNETNEAHWTAQIDQVQDKPYVIGMKWNYGAHPRADICNEIKNANVGLGPGIYPKDQVPARPHPNCLLPGQTVLMDNGIEKPIENVKIGDFVIGSSGKPCLVLNIYKNEFRGRIFCLHFSNNHELRLTGNHPLMGPLYNWVDAGNCETGDEVIGCDTQGLIDRTIINNVEVIDYEGPVFNLSVANDQSYFAERILVHNCNCFLTQEIDQDYFRNNKPSQELLRQVYEDPRFEEFHSWASGWLKKYGVPTAIPVLSLSTLNAMSAAEMRAIAADMGIENADLYSKDELIEIIRSVQGK